MSNDPILDDPDFRAWAEHTRTHTMPMMQDSALIISLVPKADVDIKFAVELGMAIMLDKPIVAVVAPGQIIAGRLRPSPTPSSNGNRAWDTTR